MQTTTDNYFTYRQCPATEDGTGTFDSIKGNTLVWNQLIQNGNFADSTGWGGQQASLSVSNNEAKITGSSNYARLQRINAYIPNVIANHKYLLSVDVKKNKALSDSSSAGGAINIRLGNHTVRVSWDVTSVNTWKTYHWFILPTSSSESASNTYFYLADCGTMYESGYEASVRNVSLFDLTAMFGSTKADEIYAMEQSSSGSGVAYFKSLFPLDYYSYDSGSLLNFGSPQEITWNQMVDAPRTELDHVTAYGVTVTITSATNSLTFNSGTCTELQRIRYNDYSMVQGHKYLISGMPSDSSAEKYFMRLNNADGSITRKNFYEPSIYTCEYTETQRLYISILQGVTVNEDVFRPQIFDLTTMFGAGNEPSVSYFKAMFPLDYYPYSSDTVQTVNVSGIKIKGKNLVSLALSPARQQRVVGVTIQSQTNEEFTITSTESGAYACLGLYYNLKKGTYTVKFQAEASDSFAPIMTVYNGVTGQVISNSIPRNTARTFTLTEDVMVEFRCFATTTSAVRTVRFYDFQLEFGSTATNYEAYHEETLSLPISQYFPNGMKSAGTVYDELTPTKAITRVGTRAYQSGDESDTSVTTDGTNTNYALTSPIETTIDEDLTYPVYVGGTEELLPVNESVPVTSPIWADIKYPDGLKTDQYFTYRIYQTEESTLNSALSIVLGKSVSSKEAQKALDIITKGE